MKVTRMLALTAFSHVIMGQIYHGDPDHPSEEGRKPYVKEEHVDELERLGYAKPITYREVEDEGARGATILGERPELDNAISNPGADQFNANPNKEELEKALQGGEGEGEGEGQGEGGGGEEDQDLALPTEIGQSIDLTSDDAPTVTIKFAGGGWFELSGVDQDGEPVSKKIRKADAESLVSEYNAYKAGAGKDPDAAPTQ